LSTGGGTATQQARPLYHLFVEKAQDLDPRFVCMVTPSRWFSGGMNLDSFRKEMLGSGHMHTLVDYPDSRHAFAGVDIAGGVSYFLWDREYSGPCSVATADVLGLGEAVARQLDAFDVFVRDNKAVAIVDRVVSTPQFKPFSDLVSPISPFGLPTSFRGDDDAAGLSSPVIVRSTAGRQYAERSVIVKNVGLLDQWKVILSATSSEHAGQSAKDGSRRVFSRIEVAEPGVAMTHSYLAVGGFATELEAQRCSDYLHCRFVRFLASLAIITQHISKATFAFVPSVDFSRDWTDAGLYAKYELTPEEIRYIEAQIKPMDSADA
jgi:site-specific DNA-methyltransferase (adenine-specific)